MGTHVRENRETGDERGEQGAYINTHSERKGLEGRGDKGGRFGWIQRTGQDRRHGTSRSIALATYLADAYHLRESLRGLG